MALSALRAWASLRLTTLRRSTVFCAGPAIAQAWSGGERLLCLGGRAAAVDMPSSSFFRRKNIGHR